MNRIFLLFGLSLFFCGCASTQKIAYLQDAQLDKKQDVVLASSITIRAQDALTIVVSSKDPELAALFNLPRISYRAGSADLQASTYDNQISGYTVDSKGNIDFPVLGLLQVKGLTREEVARLVKESLIAQNLIKDPVVTVDFLNLGFSVIGEVNKPGRFAINKDQITLLDALSMAGDLTIYGQRDRVLVTRMVNNQRMTYKLDLCSSDIYNSPAFFVQQNDVIYVEPNRMRARQATVNGNNVRSVSLWMSVASFLTTLSVLLFK